jgi:uncharacterized protein (DUF1810 family)
MTGEQHLQRFIDAQEADFDTALAEVKNGRKRSHWMWYIFPQIQGLGNSATSRLYAIRDAGEAADYLRHPVLGPRLIQISTALLGLESDNANRIFGSPDDLKLKSCMTLFALVPGADEVFGLVLDKFFGGERDGRTVQRLGEKG